MKLVLSAIVTLAAATCFANAEAKKETKSTTTTTTTAPAAGGAPTTGATTTTTHTEEKKAASATVDCKDAKNKDNAECKHGKTH